MRVLAIVCRFKFQHIDYLRALAGRFDLTVAWSGCGHEGAPEKAAQSGLPMIPLGSIEEDGLGHVRESIRAVLVGAAPEVVHLMYYFHEELTEIVRELAAVETRIVYECRDPLTTMMVGSSPGSKHWELEARALAASDGQIFVSRALRSYLERSHHISLENTSLIVPHGFSAQYVAPPEPKLSAEDGRTHIALVGTAEADPREGRYYVPTIRRLVSLGLVVHSHFHDLPLVSKKPYRDLADELGDYHDHPVLPFMQGTELSQAMSRYDLLGVFHELDAPEGNESGTLAVCMPTKAVCGWLYGGIPVVCRPHYRGLVELIEELGIGFVFEEWEDLIRISRDRDAIARATVASLAHRARFTNEWHVPRIEEFFERLRSRPARPAPIPKIASPPQAFWRRGWSRLRALGSIR